MFDKPDFWDSIIFEDNPYEEETPVEIRYFDRYGNEVTLNETD